MTARNDTKTTKRSKPVTRNYEREALQFLAARHNWYRSVGDPRCTGRSSDALAWYGIGYASRPSAPSVAGGRGQDYPLDEGDLKACEITFAIAPDWVQERMEPVLSEFKVYVRNRKQRFTTIGTDQP